MNRKLLQIILLFIVMSDCYAQDDFTKIFSEFSAQKKKEYSDFFKVANQDFAKALMDNWKAFKVFDADVRARKKSLPDSLPRPCPKENVQIDVTDVPVEYVKGKAKGKTTDAVWNYNFHNDDSQNVSDVIIDFYGKKSCCKVSSSLKALRLDGVSEKAVSSFWYKLSETDVDQLVSSVNNVHKSLNLNDWGLFKWVESLSTSVFPDVCNNERAVFTVFCLNQMGLCCKVARGEKSLLPIFASEQEVYGRKYVLIDGLKYYLLSSSEGITRLDTYSVGMDGAGNRLDLSLSQHPEMGRDNSTVVTVNSSVFENTLTLPINHSLMSFYNDYPQLDVNMYAAAEPDSDFSDAFISSVTSNLKGRKGAEAVNTILSFIQKDFRYRTDIEQFGKEKPYFCEENFVYPYNDCEDRSVLFSYLVRKLLGYNCLLLEYSDHINCAVNIREDFPQGYYIRRGESKYYICDPSCKGASIGMSGKNHQIKPQRIWVL